MRFYILDDVVDPATGRNLSVRNAVIVDRPQTSVPKCRNWCGYRGASPAEASDEDCAACQRSLIVTGDMVSETRTYPIIDGVPRLLVDRAAIDEATQESFGYEWQQFSTMLPDYHAEAGNYFDIVPVDVLRNAVVLDAGCGMARWTRHVATYPIRRVYAVDFSAAIDRAVEVLEPVGHAHCVQADVTRLPFRPGTFDFVYSLGVLHHLRNPDEGMRSLVRVLKQDGALLVYLYYALENRPRVYQWLLRGVTLIRRQTSRLRKPTMHRLAAIIGALVYWPLARFAGIVEWLGLPGLAAEIPLSHYRRYSLQFMIGDAFDRFATPIERRYTRDEIRQWFSQLGFDAIFSGRTPYWVALARRTR